MILEYDKNNKYLGRIDAKSGKIVSEGIELYNANIMKLNRPIVSLPSVIFATDLKKKDFFDTNMPPEALSFWETPGYVKLVEKSGLSSLRYELYWQSLVARVLWLAAMVVLAATCSLRYARNGGTAILMVTAIGLGFILYFLRDITYAMGQANNLPTVFAAWVPVIASSFLGITALLYLEDG